MDLVSAAKNFRKKIMRMNLKLIESIESYDYFTSQFYDCFKPYIEDSKEKLDFIESFYEELKSFDRKPIDEKTNEAYCALFDKKVLKKKIPKENSELIDVLVETGKRMNGQLSKKIEMINLNQNNEENIKIIIDVFGDLARDLKKDYIRVGMPYEGIGNYFREYLQKYKIGKVITRSIMSCFSMFYDEDDMDEELEYDETVKKLNKLDKKITECKYLLNDGGLRIIRSKNYQNFRNVILEIAKNQSE